MPIDLGTLPPPFYPSRGSRVSRVVLSAPAWYELVTDTTYINSFLEERCILGEWLSSTTVAF